MNNKTLGNSFEQKLCNILFSYGFWAKNMTQDNAGQPADIITVRNGRAYLIDCKVCSRGTFSLSRMEENQNLSMELWKMCGNGEGWFALKVDEKEIVMIPHFSIKALSHEKSTLNLKDIREYGVKLERWIEKCK